MFQGNLLDNPIYRTFNIMEAALYRALADRAKPNGWVFGSQESIAKDAKMSISSVSRHMPTMLEKCGGEQLSVGSNQGAKSTFLVPKLPTPAKMTHQSDVSSTVSVTCHDPSESLTNISLGNSPSAKSIPSEEMPSAEFKAVDTPGMIQNETKVPSINMPVTGSEIEIESLKRITSHFGYEFTDEQLNRFLSKCKADYIKDPENHFFKKMLDDENSKVYQWYFQAFCTDLRERGVKEPDWHVRDYIKRSIDSENPSRYLLIQSRMDKLLESALDGDRHEEV